MPFMAPRGAIRCDVTTTLDANQLTALAEQAMTQDSLLRKFGPGPPPDAWQTTSPPEGAQVAFVRVRNKREQRLQKTSSGGMQDTVAEGEEGTVVALRIEATDTGCSAQFWTSTTNASGKTGRIHAAPNVRKRFKAFGKLVAEADPSATVTQSED